MFFGFFCAFFQRAFPKVWAQCDFVTERSVCIWYALFTNQERVKALAAKRRKASVDQGLCVACGCCVKVCPLSAIQVERGCYAQVDIQKCVGCGKCVRECPASVVELREVPV